MNFPWTQWKRRQALMDMEPEKYARRSRYRKAVWACKVVSRDRAYVLTRIAGV